MRRLERSRLLVVGFWKRLARSHSVLSFGARGNRPSFTASADFYLLISDEDFRRVNTFEPKVKIASPGFRGEFVEGISGRF